MGFDFENKFGYDCGCIVIAAKNHKTFYNSGLFFKLLPYLSESKAAETIYTSKLADTLIDSPKIDPFLESWGNQLLMEVLLVVGYKQKIIDILKKRNLKRIANVTNNKELLNVFDKTFVKNINSTTLRDMLYNSVFMDNIIKSKLFSNLISEIRFLEYFKNPKLYEHLVIDKIDPETTYYNKYKILYSRKLFNRWLLKKKEIFSHSDISYAIEDSEIILDVLKDGTIKKILKATNTDNLAHHIGKSKYTYEILNSGDIDNVIKRMELVDIFKVLVLCKDPNKILKENIFNKNKCYRNWHKINKIQNPIKMKDFLDTDFVEIFLKTQTNTNLCHILFCADVSFVTNLLNNNHLNRYLYLMDGRKIANLLSTDRAESLWDTGKLSKYLNKLYPQDIEQILTNSPIAEKILDNGDLDPYLHKVTPSYAKWVLAYSPIKDKIKASGKLNLK